MTLFAPVDHLRVRHNFSGNNWFDFTGYLTHFTINLREFTGTHTASMSFYYAPMDPSQGSGTHVIKKGDKVRIHMHKSGGSVWRKTAKMVVTHVVVSPTDFTRPVGRQSLVTVHLRGTGVAGVAGTGGSSGVGSGKELSNVVTGAAFAIDGEATDTLTETYTWTGTANNSTSTNTDLSGDVVRTNLCPNPSLETNATSWAGAGSATVARSTVRAQVGTASLLVTWPTAGAGSPSAGAALSGLLVGETYTVSGQVYVPTGSPNVRMAAPGATGPTVTTKDAWVQTSVTWVAATTTDTVKLTTAAGSTAGQTANLDAVLVEYGADVLPYFDGATTDITVDATTTPTDGTLLRTNLCTNPSFETNTTGYSAVSGTTLTRVVGPFFVGTASLSCVRTGTTAGASYTATGLTNGQVYTVSAYALTAAGSETFAITAGTAGASVTPNGSWVRATKTFTASGTTQAVSFGFTGVTITAGNFDGVQIEAGSSATAYFDGDTTDTDTLEYAWTGTAELSTATETATFTEVADIATATEYDQIILTRDSNPGNLAFEDPDGTVQFFDPDHHRGGGIVLAFDDTVYQSIDVHDDLSHIVNVLHIHYFEKIKAGKKGTRKVEHTVTFTTNDAWASSKPYAGSIAKFGRHEKKHQLHKKADFQAYADQVFTKNANPASVPQSITFDVVSAATLLGGYEDGHYVTKQTVVTDPNGNVYACRIHRIQHNITPGTWRVQMFLREQSLIQPARRSSLVSEVGNNLDGTLYGEALADAVDATGKVISNGTVQTSDDPTANRIIILDDGSEGAIQFGTGTAGETPGRINPGVDPTPFHYVDMRTSKTASGDNSTAGRLRIEGSSGIASAQVHVFSDFLVDGNSTLDADVIVNGAVAASGAVHSGGGGLWMDDLNGGGVTTATIGNGGRIIRTTSSRRYKRNIRPLTMEDAETILGLVGVTYERRDERTGVVYPGVIAEQALEVGADLWVGLDSADRPDSFRYAETVVPLIMLVRDLRERDAAKDKLLADLTARVEALEA